jgi:prepilin-type N-terminal cleavage/methylation domain-containing protein
MSRAEQRGFTVLEAVVALAIIGATAVGVLSVFGEDQRVAGKSAQLVTASLVARERLAALELATRAELTGLPDSLASGTVDADGARFRWETAVVPVARVRDLFDLQVTVRWDAGETALRTRRFRPAITLAVR